MNNFIEVYENAMTDEMCDALIREFEYQDSLDNTWVGSAGLQKESPKPEVKDSRDFELITYFEKLYNETESSAITAEGYPYFNLIEDIQKNTMNFFKKYNYKYDYYGELINWKENKLWFRDEIKKEMDDEYMHNSFRFQPHLLIKRYYKDIQGYHVFHADFDDSSPHWLKRSHVLMYYLNDVGEGGETEFYHQKLKIKPKKGSLVIWPAYTTHLHKGNVPISNDKYILNMWIEPLFRFKDRPKR